MSPLLYTQGVVNNHSHHRHSLVSIGVVTYLLNPGCREFLNCGELDAGLLYTSKKKRTTRMSCLANTLLCTLVDAQDLLMATINVVSSVLGEDFGRDEQVRRWSWTSRC